MQVTGKVIDTKNKKGKSKAGKEWMSKTVVVEYEDGQFKKNLAVELFGENNINNNPVRKGQTVTIDFSVESREYNGNWYTSANAWKISTGATQETQSTTVDLSAAATDTSQLPF